MAYIGTRITASQAGGQNVVAFLRMLAYSEGTDNGRQKTNDSGYDVLVGGNLFNDYSKHPNVLVTLNSKGLKSTAAGRYQFLKKTWDSLAKMHGYKDFSPENQDYACIELIKGRKALAAVKAGNIPEAINLCRKEWASLPGAGYGQHEQKLDTLLGIYKEAGGKLA